jgi:hypothetical protein
MYIKTFFTCLILSTFTACSFASENWAGLEGGGLRHNASAVDIEPAQLKTIWSRTFPTLPIGDQKGPNDENNFAAGKGAWNLTLIEGKIAIVAAQRADVPNELNDYYCTVLNASDGKTQNFIRIKSSQGNSRAYRWPHYCVSASGDNISGIVQVAWDPQTGIFFAAQGAYLSSYTAWLPLANMDSFQPATFQEGIPAYRQLQQKHPGFQDAFGRTRSEMKTVFGSGNIIDEIQPYTWGLSGLYLAPQRPKSLRSDKPRRYDEDFLTLFGVQGSSYYNTSSHFTLDTQGPLIGLCKGADWGHNTGGDAYLFSKYTGMKVTTSWPYPAGIERLRPFTSGGVIIGNGRVFCAGPAEGRLGIDRPEGRVPKMDQGLYLWAYDCVLSDEKANDGFSGPGINETATLKPAFVRKFDSRFTPDPADIMSYGQSYYECDGFYRNKAMLIDGKDLWMAWKPSAKDSVELIHASDQKAETFSLGVGSGLYGVDLWPKISLSCPGGRKIITYFTGYARYRKRFIPEDTEAALRRIHGEDFSKLSQDEIKNTLKHARQAGIWDKELLPPRGPAQLAVFDVVSGKLKWTYNVSKNHPTLPENEFWTFLDKTQMVTAGKWAYIGWVDTTDAQAVLRLLAFDITLDKPVPVVKTFPLGFTSRENEKSVLFDLIAADGRLYALITQSQCLWIRDPRWTNQHVLAIGRP